MMRSFLAAAWLGALLCGALGCSDVTTSLVSSRQDVDAARRVVDAGHSGLVTVPDTGTSTAPTLRTPVICGQHVCACDNGLDDDADGLTDGFDTECTSAYDDDESSFATGATQGPRAKCGDCFWDANKGSGDDDCHYPEVCLLGESPTGPGSGGCSTCVPSQHCIDTCQVNTPNGCDCFGCCELTRPDGSRISVLLTEQCSLATLDDTSRCPRCVQSPSCKNPCGMCELCPGRKEADLPALCRQGHPANTPAHVCDEGATVCSADAACPSEFYCHLGCCLHIVQ